MVAYKYLLKQRKFSQSSAPCVATKHPDETLSREDQHLQDFNQKMNRLLDLVFDSFKLDDHLARRVVQFFTKLEQVAQSDMQTRFHLLKQAEDALKMELSHRVSMPFSTHISQQKSQLAGHDGTTFSDSVVA